VRHKAAIVSSLDGAVAWAHHREQAGWADASPPCPSIRI
jgi:hypothetical protein